MATVRRRSRLGLLLAAALVLGTWAAPAPAQEEAAASPAADLLKFAPEGTWGVALLDVQKALSSPMFEGLRQADMKSYEQMSRFQSAAFFLLPMELPLDDADAPSACGVAKLAAGAADALREALDPATSVEVVAGLDAYEVGELLGVFVDETTLVLGSDEEALATAVQVYRAGAGAGLGQKLGLLVGRHVARQFSGALLMPAPLSEALSEDAAMDMPDWMMGMRTAAAGVDLTEGLKFRFEMGLGSAEDAQQLLTKAREGIESAKAALKKQFAASPMTAVMGAQFLTAMNKVNLAAEGSEFQVSVDLEPEEMSGVSSLMMVPMMMGARMGSHEGEMSTGGGAEKSMSRSNLHNIGLGLQMYRNANEDRYPPNLFVLLDKGYLEDEDVLVDPADWEPVLDDETGTLYSYQYVGPVPSEVPENFIVCYSRKGVYEDGRNVLYADGAADWVEEADLHAAGGARGMSLEECYRWAAGHWDGELSEKDDARLKKFFEVTA